MVASGYASRFLMVANCEARLRDDGVGAGLAAVGAHVAREVEREGDGSGGADGDGAAME